MRLISVVGLSGLGMMVTSAGVWLATPLDGAFLGPEPRASIVTPGVVTPPSEVHLPGTVRADGRLGHASFPANLGGETHAFVELQGIAPATAAKPAPLELSIVIDRSGSMRGQRLANALAAARGAIARMRDGDVVSVITYDTAAHVVVPPTSVTSAARPSLEAQVAAITASGNTCISCGLAAAQAGFGAPSGRVRRILLLSDGEATAGVLDVPGFKRIAAAIAEQGISISSIGVDVEYNEKVMSTLALESNGRHYFADNDAALPRIFEQELASLARTVAADAELVFEPAPGVEVLEIYDRAHRLEGGRVVVPLGTFSAEERKTFLARVRVPPSGAGTRPIGEVKLRYRDLTRGEPVATSGALALAVAPDQAVVGPLDPNVALRVSRSGARNAIEEANALYQQGRVAEARARLEQQVAVTRAANAAATSAPPAKRAAIDGEYSRQAEALEKADDGFAPSAGPNAAPAPARARAGQAQVRANADWATEAAY